MQRLAIARQMGFDLVIGGSGLDSGPQAAREYAQAAQQFGIQVAWPLSDERWWIDFDPAADDLLGAYPAWAKTCDCQSNEELLQYMVTTLAGIPNTWGWYAADDLQLRKPETVEAVKGWTQRLKSLAPQQATLISVWNTLPQYRDAADFVAQESYPFGLPQGFALASPWRDIAGVAQETERLTPGRASYILQGFSWGGSVWDAQAVGVCGEDEPPASCLPQFRYPTPREQRRQRQTILLNSRPALLLWYGLGGTLGPSQPRSDPNWNDPAPQEASTRMASLSSAVQAAPPRTRACLRLHRRHRGWVADARASRALGGVRRVSWRHPGLRRRGRGLQVALRAGGHPASTVKLVLRDAYQGTAKVTASLSTRHKQRTRCGRVSLSKRW